MMACSTPERPKSENTNLIWGQENKSIEDIFGKIRKDDYYHTGNKVHGAGNKNGFWPGGRGRFPSSQSDCGNNKWSNYRNPTSLHGVNRDGLTSQINTYEVKVKHETLMLIAYKIYGDYSLWRVLADLNQDVLGGGIDVHPGMLLRYYVPVEGYSFIPEGNPFLVRKGHSLSLISDLVYRDWRRWKEIYSHNQPFIKNSNLIYEGSTLFYVPDSKVSSNKRIKLPKRRSKGKYSNYKNTSKYRSGKSKGRSVSSTKMESGSSGGGYYRIGDLKNKKIKKIRVLSSSQVEGEEIIPVRKAQYSKKNIAVINKIKKAIENTHGDTEINGSSKFDRYVEDNFID